MPFIVVYLLCILECPSAHESDLAQRIQHRNLEDELVKG